MQDDARYSQTPSEFHSTVLVIPVDLFFEMERSQAYFSHFRRGVLTFVFALARAHMARACIQCLTCSRVCLIDCRASADLSLGLQGTASKVIHLGPSP